MSALDVRICDQIMYLESFGFVGGLVRFKRVNK